MQTNIRKTNILFLSFFFDKVNTQPLTSISFFVRHLRMYAISLPHPKNIPFDYVRKIIKIFDPPSLPARFKTMEKVLRNKRHTYKFDNFYTLPPSQRAYIIKVWLHGKNDLSTIYSIKCHSRISWNYFYLFQNSWEYLSSILICLSSFF